MPINEYMTPEIGKVIPLLSQTCDELTRQALIRAITKKTQEWVEGDPELADILLEGTKTLEECVRYVTEKAACVIAKNINATLNAEFSQLPKMTIQGNEATMAGGAVDDEQVYGWAQEYYYDPNAKPTDFKEEAKRKADAAAREAERKKADAAKKANKKGAKKSDDKANSNADVKQSPTPAKDETEEKNTTGPMDQISLSGFDQAAA